MKNEGVGSEEHQVLFQLPHSVNFWFHKVGRKKNYNSLRPLKQLGTTPLLHLCYWYSPGPRGRRGDRSSCRCVEGFPYSGRRGDASPPLSQTAHPSFLSGYSQLKFAYLMHFLRVPGTKRMRMHSVKMQRICTQGISIDTQMHTYIFQCQSPNL